MADLIPRKDAVVSERERVARALCLIPNCRRIAAAPAPFCAQHRDKIERATPLPCPWCGGYPQKEWSDLDARYQWCSGCGASGPVEKTDADAITAWNTRADAALSAMDRPKLPARVVKDLEQAAYFFRYHHPDFKERAAGIVATAALRATHIIVEDQPNE